ERDPRVGAAPERTVTTRDARAAYQDLVRGRLNEFDHRFDGLEARMRGLSRAEQERLRIDIAELRDRKAALEKKFKDLQDVSNESWLDLKASLDRGLDQLEVAYNVVAANNNGAERDVSGSSRRP